MNLHLLSPALRSHQTPTPPIQPASRFVCLDGGDGYAGSCDHNPGIYRSSSFAKAEASLLTIGFPSHTHSIGEPDSGVDRGWTRSLGEVPKDCYYCKGTGKCYMDTPAMEGGGKDYMGAKCNACSGTGVCPRCGGDGVIGRPGSTTENTH